MKKLIENRFGWGTPVEYALLTIVVSVFVVCANGVGGKVFTTLAQAVMSSSIGQLLHSRLI